MKNKINVLQLQIAREFEFQLNTQKALVKSQMESMVGQNGIIKKLCNSIVSNEHAILNQRFIFYKMTNRDTMGQ